MLAREKSSFEGETTLWRGLRDVVVPEAFLIEGGTELAPMSTSRSLEVAVRYSTTSTATCALLIKLSIPSFMQQGADLNFLSAFPDEEEVLYPPLTCAHQSHSNSHPLRLPTPTKQPPPADALRERAFACATVSRSAAMQTRREGHNECGRNRVHRD
jgi:hypothetical protein